MATATFIVDDKKFRKDIEKITRYMNEVLPTEMYNEFKYNTPVDSGNAQRKTKLKIKKDEKEIQANYDYAGVLDSGLYGKPPGTANGPKTRRGYSKQAPNGMTTPTLDKARELVNKAIKEL